MTVPEHSDVLVRIESLAKSFSGVPAVAGLSLLVRAGEIYGLLGPNGAGKTTTLRMLAGLMRPEAGRVVVAGADASAEPRVARAHLGFLGAGTGLYARLTARELLVHFGRLFGVPEPRLRTRLDELSQALDLGPLLDRRCESLSTGQRQRVSIARALIHDPAVLVLDEPSSGLDVLASRFLRSFVLAERGRGKGVIFSTHYLAEAELLCDRVGLLHRGRLLAEGSPATLRAELQAGSLEEVLIRLVEQTEAAGAGSPAGGGFVP